MITIWRRHVQACPHRQKGRDYIKCSCPIWADGYVDGRRVLRKSLGTRDMARARKKAVLMESEDAKNYKTLPDAISAFLAHCESDGLKFSTRRKYTNCLNKLSKYCASKGIDSVGDIDTDCLDGYRSTRNLKLTSSLNELQFLRIFCGYCFNRKWMDSNPAKSIKAPRNIQPNSVEPFTAQEVSEIIKACDEIGNSSYERLRSRAMILTLRYTALRMGDVALLARDRISRDGSRWRIFLRSEKSGKPIFLPIPNELKDALDMVPVPRKSPAESKHFFWNGHTPERTYKAMVGRTLKAAFKKSGITKAHAHRFRHTLATELLGRGASFEDVADILGNSPNVVRKHYAKWSPARQGRIDDLMSQVHSGADYVGHNLGTHENNDRKSFVN